MATQKVAFVFAERTAALHQSEERYRTLVERAEGIFVVEGGSRQVLESTDAPIDRVAADAGCGTPASLRQHLRASIGVAPGTYRRTYRGLGVTGPSPV